MEQHVQTEVVRTDSEPREPMSVEDFISRAIDTQLPVETMERLFVLRKEVKAEMAREAFTAALSKFQAACPTVEKTKVVKDKYGKERYRFAPIDKIAEQIKTPLADARLSFTTDVINESGFMTAVVKVTHVLGHSETSSFRVPIDKDAYMSAPQQYAAALTFAKRYAFCNALGILTGDEDTDAVPEEKESQARPATRPSAPTPRPQPVTQTEIDRHSTALHRAETMEQLADAWAAIPERIRPHLKDIKDRRKVELSY